MTGEYLSIETINKIARLEKENKEMSDIITKYDKEVNRLFNLTKKVIEYIKQNGYENLGGGVGCIISHIVSILDISKEGK